MPAPAEQADHAARSHLTIFTQGLSERSGDVPAGPTAELTGRIIELAIKVVP